MDAGSPTDCPRCGQENLPQARYCAECGLNMETAGTSPGAAGTVAQRVDRGPLRAGTLVVILLIVLGIALAVFASYRSNLRAYRRSVARPVPLYVEPSRADSLIIETRSHRTVSRFELVN
jgi:hypothetical protein